MNNREIKIAVIGLGYVGLPLAVEAGKKYKTVGYDINEERLDLLSNGFDSTMEVSAEEISSSKYLQFSGDLEVLCDCNFYIVTVPTPVNECKQPDLNPLRSASMTVSRILNTGDIVIYESTVYPGATEDVCVPILEEFSGLKFNVDFFVGYSPERINPGDKSHRLSDILKVTSGSTEESAGRIDQLYKTIISAGTYLAPSIKVAEAAKVIENTQRDVNIGLINELAIIFSRIGIDTKEVLDAAETKWNFLPFRPGLVGGHCIGVDPYYLTHKAQSIGYHPEVILAGRRINDSMSSHVASTLIKEMLKRKINVSKSRVLIMGITFKEDCPDLRNTKVFDLVDELTEVGVDVECYDPWVNLEEIEVPINIKLTKDIYNQSYDAAIIAVAHKQFYQIGGDKIRSLVSENGLVFDLKYLLDKKEGELRL